MKWKYFGILLMFFSQDLVSQTFVIQRGQDAFSFNDINVALDSLVSGDYLYVPGGTYNVSFKNQCYRWIPENSHIVGAGHYEDFSPVSGKTILKSTNVKSSGCSSGRAFGIPENGSVTGIEFHMDLSFRNGTGISFCKFNSLIQSSNLNLYANVFTNIYNLNANGSAGIGGIIKKNIITGSIGGVFSFFQYEADYQLIIDSNIFLDTSSNIINVTEAVIKNNIILSSSTLGGIGIENSILRYNAWGTSLPPNWDESTNIFGIDPNSTFLNYEEGDRFSYDLDFHLAQGSPLNNADENDDDIGIYKTNQAIENKVPRNPYFTESKINSETDGNGKLKVRIKTKSN